MANLVFKCIIFITIYQDQQSNFYFLIIMEKLKIIISIPIQLNCVSTLFLLKKLSTTNV